MTSEHKPFSWLRTREFWFFFVSQFVLVLAIAYVLSPYEFTAFDLHPGRNTLAFRNNWLTVIISLSLAQLLTAALLPKIAFWKMAVLVVLNASSFFLQPYGSIGVALALVWRTLSWKRLHEYGNGVRTVFGVFMAALFYAMTVAGLMIIVFTLAVVTVFIIIFVAFLPAGFQIGQEIGRNIPPPSL
ncbi:MAG: hypothetical protein WC813_01910 [Patescibacteria group bacterium]|jgi:hypothetical protein